MTSHEYAKRLHEIADFLLSRPECGLSLGNIRLYNYFCVKDKFLAAVKSLGSGTKTYDSTDLHFSPVGAPEMILAVSRHKVCRKVQEEKWECESLLSPDEEAQVGA